MRECSCANLPKLVSGTDENLPVQGLEQVAVDPARWRTLYKCLCCGQHGQADVWDKYQTGLCIKVHDPGGWTEFEDQPLRLQFLIQSRGGLSSETCCWKGCESRALEGLAFCPEHAYWEMGLRA